LANTKTAKKMIRVQAKKRLRNLSVRTGTKTAVKKVLENISAHKEAESVSALRAAFSLLDKAASKGIIHKNEASRKKSRLARKLISAFKKS